MNARIAKKILKAVPQGRHRPHQIIEAKARAKRHGRPVIYL